MREGRVNSRTVGDVASQRQVLFGVWQQGHRGGGILFT